MNLVILAGRIGTVRELRTFNDGGASLGFSLATSFRSKSGETWTEGTEWHECVLKGKRAMSLAPHLFKGLGLTVHGSLRTRQYDARDGQRRKVTEVMVRELEFGAEPKGGRTDPAPPMHVEQDDVPF